MVLYDLADLNNIRQIPAYPNYFISDRGDVFSRHHWHHRMLPDGKVRRISVNYAGFYPFVGLSKNQKRTSFAVHRLVLYAFVGPRPDGMECRHIDGDRKNFCLDNLAWGTPLENSEDQVRHKTRALGTRRWNASLNDEKIKIVWELFRAGVQQSEIARRVDSNPCTIHDVIFGVTWTHLSLALKEQFPELGIAFRKRDCMVE